MKAKEVEPIYKALMGLDDKHIPAHMGLILAQNKRKLFGLNEDINNRREKILLRYAARDENDELVISEHGVKLQDPENYKKDMAELMETESDIVFGKISMEDVEKCNGEQYDTLTLAEISAMVDMITE